jgi:hypothetical protein
MLFVLILPIRPDIKMLLNGMKIPCFHGVFTFFLLGIFTFKKANDPGYD